MAVSVAVKVAKQFEVKAKPETVFALLSDVPRSVGHFPKVQQLVALGGGRYRWEMEPMGTAGISHQVRYACTYAGDAGKGSVTWTPVKGEGNGSIRGSWTLKPSKTGTVVSFETEGTLDVPVPRLLKSVAEPFVLAEFERSIRSYIDNLSKTLNQGA